MCGSLYYFYARRFELDVKGVLQPFAVLAVPFAGLNVAAHLLERRGHKAVAVAFYLGGISLLPLFLLIAFHDLDWWVAPADTAGQLFLDGSVSNTPVAGHHLRGMRVGGVAGLAHAHHRPQHRAGRSRAAVHPGRAVGLRPARLVRGRAVGPARPAPAPARARRTSRPASLLERSGVAWFGRPLYTAAAVLLDRDARTARAGRPPLLLPDRPDAGVPGRVGERRHAPRHGDRPVPERRPLLPRRLARRLARHRADEAGRMAAVHRRRRSRSWSRWPT